MSQLKYPRVTLADVRASINPNVPSDVAVRWFGRPAGNLMTPFFHNRGWTANEVTVVRTGIALAGVALLALPSPVLWMISGAIYYFTFLLDCVDGNLARLQKDVTYLGKFIDGLSDAAYPLFAPFAMSIGISQEFDATWTLVPGALGSILYATNQMLRNRLSFFREWMTGLTGPLTAAELHAADAPRRLQSQIARWMVNGYFLAPLALFIPGQGGPVFLGLTFVFQLIPDLCWSYATLAESNALLRRPRQSKHSPAATGS